MKRSTSIALIATAALLAGPGKIYAQEADIKAAIGAYRRCSRVSRYEQDGTTLGA